MKLSKRDQETVRGVVSLEDSFQETERLANLHINNYKAELQKAQETERLLNQEKQKLATRNYELERRIKELEGQVLHGREDLINDLRKANERIKELEETNEGIANMIEEEAEENMKELDHWEAKLKEAQREIASLKETIKGLDAEIQGLDKELKTKWISVSERLPKDNIEVLAVMSGMSRITTTPLGGATHWMPLPDPPEKIKDRTDPEEIGVLSLKLKKEGKFPWVGEYSEEAVELLNSRPDPEPELTPEQKELLANAPDEVCSQVDPFSDEISMDSYVKFTQYLHGELKEARKDIASLKQTIKGLDAEIQGLDKELQRAIGQAGRNWTRFVHERAKVTRLEEELEARNDVYQFVKETEQGDR